VFRLLLTFLFPLFLLADAIHLPLKSVDEESRTATVETGRIEPGISGFIVRHFNEERSIIIANARVIGYDEEHRTATLQTSEYTGLRQSSLPRGDWKPEAGDEAVLAFAYSRALLLAPTEAIYRTITARVPSVEWMHPDGFATYLSYEGHPTPIKEDIGGYCTLATAGLLYIYAKDALFTLDCQSLKLLQITPAEFALEVEPKLPFYSRVKEIKAAWWGEGSGTLEAYDPYYLQLLVENNPTSKMLYDFVQTNDSNNTELLDQFEIEEQ
jgi:hypothetical protein